MALLQLFLGTRVAWRLLRGGRGTAIRPAPPGSVAPASISIIVPVLNEAQRLLPCLNGILQQGQEVGEILVVDSGSVDGTWQLVRACAQRDSRVRVIEAGPAPDDWNGKVWGLDNGKAALDGRAEWVLTLDADVVPAPDLAGSLVKHAELCDVRMLSVATQQVVRDAVLDALHPSMLATLVYRFGRPGGATSNSCDVLANGQCCLIRRDLLDRMGGFRAVKSSLCEDVSLGRLAARMGEPVGFYEADDLIAASMYVNWRDAWSNWPRSLALRDAFSGVRGWLGLLEVLLVQSLPPVLFAVAPRGIPRQINLFLLAMRLGVLVGIARAYPHRSWTFWTSPIADLPVAFAVWRSVLAPRQIWRGRTYRLEKGSIAGA